MNNQFLAGYRMRSELRDLCVHGSQVTQSHKHWKLNHYVTRQHEAFYAIALRFSGAELLLNPQILLTIFDPRAAQLLQKLPNKWYFYQIIQRALAIETVTTPKISFDCVLEAVHACTEEIRRGSKPITFVADLSPAEIEGGLASGALLLNGSGKIEIDPTGKIVGEYMVNPMIESGFCTLDPIDQTLEEKYAAIADWCVKPHPFDSPDPTAEFKKRCHLAILRTPPRTTNQYGAGRN